MRGTTIAKSLEYGDRFWTARLANVFLVPVSDANDYWKYNCTAAWNEQWCQKRALFSLA